MTLRTQVLVWVGFTAVVVLAVWFLRPVLLPFVVGLVLAYILNPLVVFIQRARIGRGWAIALAMLFVIALLVGVVFLVTPLIVSQITGLLYLLPGLVGDLQDLIRQLTPQLMEWMGPERAEQLETTLIQFIGSGVDFAVNVTASLLQNSLNVLNTVGFMLITPVVAFYLLLDWEGMMKGIDDLLPREHRREIREVFQQIDRAMAGVLRGYGSVILVLCIYYATALSLTGLNFGLVIGIITGLLSFIPFVGFLVGFGLSMGVALVQFAPNWWPVLIVFLVGVIGQFLEGNILYPRLVGQSINLNSAWLMFALVAFAYLFGFIGLLLAVPMAAITGTLVRYAVKRYKESELYRGKRPVKAGHSEPEPEPALIMPAVAPEAPTRARPAASKVTPPRRKRQTPAK